MGKPIKMGGKAQDLTQSRYSATMFPAEALVFQIQNGTKGAIGQMPAFNGRLNDIQLKAVATYVNSIANNGGQ